MSQPFAELTTAPLFTSSAGVGDAARLVQAMTKRGHLAGDFGAHSLRAGFVTSAAQKRVPKVDIQRVTGHRSVATLRGYVRRATLFGAAVPWRRSLLSEFRKWPAVRAKRREFWTLFADKIPAIDARCMTYEVVKDEAIGRAFDEAHSKLRKQIMR